MYHCQCELKKRNKCRVLWIPEKYAKVGKVLRLINDNGWEVTSVNLKMESRIVRERSVDYRNQRKMSDV